MLMRNNPRPSGVEPRQVTTLYVVPLKLMIVSLEPISYALPTCVACTGVVFVSHSHNPNSSSWTGTRVFVASFVHVDRATPSRFGVVDAARLAYPEAMVIQSPAEAATEAVFGYKFTRSTTDGNLLTTLVIEAWSKKIQKQGCWQIASTLAKIYCR